jgi:hypothetical protein
MAANVNVTKGGEFATTRRGGMDAWERAFIAQKLECGVPVSAIERMLGRAAGSVEAYRASVAAPEPAPPPPPVKVVPVGAPLGSLAAICCEVAERHQMSPAVLVGQSRKAPAVRARQEAFCLAYEVRFSNGERRYSTTQTGRFFGGRDHTTVLAGMREHLRRSEESA